MLISKALGGVKAVKLCAVFCLKAGRMNFFRRLLYALPVALAACSAQAGGEGGYQLGKGLHLGDSGLWLGGYADLQVEDLKHTHWSAQLSDLSLFVGWQRGRWRFFSEFEVGEALVVSNGQGLTTHKGYFDLERLYLDYLHDDALAVRFGKFLTPIGRWNQIHANPLVWTTSSPMVVEGPFPMHASGGMALGNFNALGTSWGYNLYGGGGNQLDFKPAEESRDDNFRDIIGFRLYHEEPGRALFGLSYAHYTERKLHPGAKDLVGVDAFWTRHRYELSGEFIYRFGAGERNPALDEEAGSGNLWGLYLQGVAPLVGDVYGIVRYEAFQREGAESPGHLWLTGLAYRPLPPLVFKAEYRFGADTGGLPPSKISGGLSEGFAASVAVLF